MGKINPDILGCFSGKEGNVPVDNRKGIGYVHTKATSVSNPCTDGQVLPRTKLALVLAIQKLITGFLRVG